MALLHQYMELPPSNLIGIILLFAQFQFHSIASCYASEVESFEKEPEPMGFTGKV